MSKVDTFHHLVRFDQDRQIVAIDRVFLSGATYLYVEIDLSSHITSEVGQMFDLCATQIGEAIILDSPIARKILDL